MNGKIAGAIPLFVPLFGAYPVLYLASANPGQASWGTVLSVCAVAAIAAVTVFALVRFIALSRISAGIATAFVVVMFFTYGQFVNWLDLIVVGLRLGDHQTPNILDAAPGARRAIAFAWAALALFGAWRIARAPWAAKPEIGKAATFATLLLAVMAVASVAFGLRGSSDQAHTISSAEGSGRSTGRSRPDIYFIVLDGYARADVLARYYRFDNSPFLNGLRRAGFDVAERSSSNYNWTFLSLASTLNMGYLQELFPKGFTPGSSDRSVLYEAIRNSLTSRFLRERGYSIVHLQSTWGATATNDHADRQIRCEFSVYSNEFVRTLAEASWLGAFHSKAGTDLAGCHLANFESLARLGGEAGPKFVFAHFILPHHPYLFDRDGNVLRNAVISNQFEFQKRLWEDKASYQQQLEFTNKKVLEAVTAILRASKTPPIIIIESDHGPGLTAGLTSGQHYALRFASLGAYYLPGAPADLIPDGGTAVNQFRRVLSFYFGAGLEPLPDRHFVSSYGNPYAFREMPHELLAKLWTQTLALPQSAGAPEAVAEKGENADE